MRMHVWDMQSPAGKIQFSLTDQGGLSALGFADHWERLAHRVERRFGDVAWKSEQGTTNVHAALGAYFDGRRDAFDQIELELLGTDFQRKVWQALCAIPYGETRSYQQLATAIGQPNAIRAVGTANGANPVSIAVPCHRVIQTGGALGGYAGGLDRKRWLLNHEAAGRFKLSTE